MTRFRWRWTISGAVVALVMAAGVPGVTAAPARTSSPLSGSGLDCASAHSFDCVDVYSPTAVGNGAYVGHDEPSTLFYSNRAGSGNNSLYLLRLPKDPPVQPNQAGTGGTFNFQLHPAFWFGMAMCDSQSFPEYTSTCQPDSDTNIAASADPSSPSYIGKHPGAAYMEMQFYPPGWVSWPAGNSCAGTQWCAALNIDSYTATPAGGVNNTACLNTVGIEPVNFAFITRNGRAQAPANPVAATAATYTPDPTRDLFMNSGDLLAVSLRDTPGGFQVIIYDSTTHQSGSMKASAGNGFAQVLYQPTATSCAVAPHNFHPMYATSGPNTRVVWAAHSYNVAMADEIGHFEYCGTVTNYTCTQAGVTETDGQLDADDVGCFSGDDSTAVNVDGCLGTDSDFDGPEYANTWPGTGSPSHDALYTPTPIQFSSPRFNGLQRYSQVAFETDLPRIEVPSCNRTTGAGCVNPPTGAQFYPFFTTTNAGPGHSCMWQLGGAIPGATNTFGGSSTTEYGALLYSLYPSVDTSSNPVGVYRYNNFRQVLSTNPC